MRRTGQFSFNNSFCRCASKLPDNFDVRFTRCYCNNYLANRLRYRHNCSSQTVIQKQGRREISGLYSENILLLMYHGCGSADAIFEDYIEAEIDVYNPFEAKAGNDVVELCKKHGNKITFFGNSNIKI